MFIISLIGFAILMLSPGSKVRMKHPTSIDFYNLSLFEKLKMNIPAIIFGNFCSYTRIFTILFFMTTTYISYINYFDKSKKNK